MKKNVNYDHDEKYMQDRRYRGDSSRQYPPVSSRAKCDRIDYDNFDSRYRPAVYQGNRLRSHGVLRKISKVCGRFFSGVCRGTVWSYGKIKHAINNRSLPASKREAIYCNTVEYDDGIAEGNYIRLLVPARKLI